MSLIYDKCVVGEKGWACGCDMENGHLCGEPLINYDFYFICDKCLERFGE